MWVGTEDGLNLFNAATERFQVYRPPVPPGLLRRYREIDEDRQGRLWIGTLGDGLHCFDPSSGQFKIYRQGDGTLSSDQVPTVHADRSGTGWAGTQNGLDRLDPATTKFTRYYEKDGLADNNVSKILEDERGHL